MHNLNNNIMDQEYEFTFVNQLFKAGSNYGKMGSRKSRDTIPLNSIAERKPFLTEPEPKFESALAPDPDPAPGKKVIQKYKKISLFTFL